MDAGGRLKQWAVRLLRPSLQLAGSATEFGLIVLLLVVSAAWLASGTYNPFIYFRF